MDVYTKTSNKEKQKQKRREFTHITTKNRKTKMKRHNRNIKDLQRNERRRELRDIKSFHLWSQKMFQDKKGFLKEPKKSKALKFIFYFSKFFEFFLTFV